MSETGIDCQHACKNTCSSLNEALRKETAIIKYYEAVLAECSIARSENVYG